MATTRKRQFEKLHRLKIEETKYCCCIRN